jgi:hypothetical protein
VLLHDHQVSVAREWFFWKQPWFCRETWNAGNVMISMTQIALIDLVTTLPWIDVVLKYFWNSCNCLFAENVFFSGIEQSHVQENATLCITISVDYGVPTSLCSRSLNNKNLVLIKASCLWKTSKYALTPHTHGFSY